MNETTFDSISKRAAFSTSRRTALGGALAGLTGLITVQRAVAQDGTPFAAPTPDPNADGPEDPAFLFVQPFDSGTWMPNPDQPDTYILTLTGAAAQTIYFSDRPERIVGLSPTDEFLESLGFTPANPPNAALVSHSDTGEQDVLVIELFDPEYDAGTGVLTYQARILADYEGAGLASLARTQQDDEHPERFGAGNLFIDDCPVGTAACYKEIDDKRQGVGEFTWKCCYDSDSKTCTPCSHGSGTSASFGQLCNQLFPSSCSYQVTLSGETYDCFVDSWTCG